MQPSGAAERCTEIASFYVDVPDPETALMVRQSTSPQFSFNPGANLLSMLAAVDAH